MGEPYTRILALLVNQLFQGDLVLSELEGVTPKRGVSMGVANILYIYKGECMVKRHRFYHTGSKAGDDRECQVSSDVCVFVV